MAKKKKAVKFAGHDAVPRSYYDPGARPKAEKPVMTTHPNLGPIQNTRHARRARARLPFIEQRALALKVGFPVPPEHQLTEATGARFWIETWEDGYTRLVIPKPEAGEPMAQVLSEARAMKRASSRGA